MKAVFFLLLTPLLFSNVTIAAKSEKRMPSSKSSKSLKLNGEAAITLSDMFETADPRNGDCQGGHCLFGGTASVDCKTLIDEPEVPKKDRTVCEITVLPTK